MTGYLNPQGGFNWGQFGGDALQGLGAGLLARGAGGQYAQQAPLIGIQALQQAQAQRAEAEQRALQNQSLTQEMAIRDQQASRQAEADRQARAQQQAYLGLIGGQPRQGPVQPGQPALGNAPTNPTLSGLPPAIQSMLPAMSADQGMALVAQMAARKPSMPNLEHVRQGNQDVSGYFDPNDPTRFVQVASGSAFAPQQPQQLPSDIQEYNLDKSQGFKGTLLDWKLAQKGAGFTTTLPDGTVIQMGGSTKPVTEAQATAGSRAGMISDGMTKLFQTYDNPNVNIMRTLGATALDQIPVVGQTLGNELRSGPEQEQKTAKAIALEGIASAVTGAGVAKDQFIRYQSMLPDPTDKPGTRVFKLKVANNFLRQQLIAAGPSGKEIAAQIDWNTLGSTDTTPSSTTPQTTTPIIRWTRDAAGNPVPAQ